MKKIIGLTNLGNVVVERGTQYKFTVVEEDCSKPCSDVEVQIETDDKLYFSQNPIRTDRYGVGEFRVTPEKSELGLCEFTLNLV